MTDPTPSNLSPYGEHAPGPEPLSPAAEAIFFAADGMQPRQYRGRALGAALRALAVRVKGADAIRQDILDIATELEGRP